MVHVSLMGFADLTSQRDLYKRREGPVGSGYSGPGLEPALFLPSPTFHWNHGLKFTVNNWLILRQEGRILYPRWLWQLTARHAYDFSALTGEATILNVTLCCKNGGPLKRRLHTSTRKTAI